MNEFKVDFGAIEKNSPLKSGKICLADADFLKYLYVFKITKFIEDGIEYDRDEVYKEVMYKFFEYTEDPVIFCFSSKSFNTYRYGVSFVREYKGNRKTSEPYDGCDEDKFYFMDKIIKEHNTLLFSDLEADDIVSMLQNEYTYILSQDKDLNQVPGYHFSFSSNKLYQISEEEAFDNLLVQVAIGDSTDNIAGIDRFGSVTANKEFKDLHGTELLSKVQELYLNKYGIENGLDRFCEMYMLVKTRMKRGENFINKYLQAFNLLDILISRL